MMKQISKLVGAGLLLGGLLFGSGATAAPAAPAVPELRVRKLEKADFHIFNVCSHAAFLAVRVLETKPASSADRMDLALKTQEALAADGRLEEQTPGVVEVTLAMVAVETLLKGGQMPAPGQMHDWFVAQAAASCAKSLEVRAAP